MIGTHQSQPSWPGFVQAIHVFLPVRAQDVDGRDVCAKTRFALLPGHDDRDAAFGSQP